MRKRLQPAAFCNESLTAQALPFGLCGWKALGQVLFDTSSAFKLPCYDATRVLLYTILSGHTEALQCRLVYFVDVAGYVIEIDKDTKASSLADSFRNEIQRKLKDMNVRRGKDLPFQAVNEALLSSTGRAIFL